MDGGERWRGECLEDPSLILYGRHSVAAALLILPKLFILPKLKLGDHRSRMTGKPFK